MVGGYLLLMNIVGLYVMYSDKRSDQASFPYPGTHVIHCESAWREYRNMGRNVFVSPQDKTLVFCCRNAFDLVVSVRGGSILSVPLIRF